MTSRGSVAPSISLWACVRPARRDRGDGDSGYCAGHNRGAELFGSAGQRDGERLQDAAMLADELLEQVLAVGPDQFRRVFGMRGECEPPFDMYSYEMEIRSVGSGDPYSVAVTVFWDDLGQSRNLRFQTLVAPRIGDNPDPIRTPQSAMERR
ncbi:MAG: hypothetical protein ACNA8P_06170 [Phycisphaerales bacterium]